MVKVTIAFLAIWLMGLLLVSPVAAQRCDGIEVRIGAGVQRCLKPGAAQSFRDCASCPEMVVVPAGRFTMGTPPDESVATTREDQTPVTILRPFAVGRLSVTRGEFAAFVAASGHRLDGGCYDLTAPVPRAELARSWRAPGFEQTDRHPVVCVSWHDAKAYVAWLAKSTGKPYRLLSEAEREYVARAGSITAYWWGNEFSVDLANYNATYVDGSGARWRRMTVAADAFAPNPWGLHNVHGNVWEWTEDCWNEKNAGNPGNGRARTTGDCTLRVSRGGSWNTSPFTVRSGKRGMEPAGFRSSGQGFRVARAL